MRRFSQDCRHALRQLRNSPLFSLIVIVTLALAIGSTTAIFSTMDAVLLRMLPVRQPQRLFYLSHINSPSRTSSTGDMRYTFGINVYNRLREDKSAFSDVIAYVPLALTKTGVRYGETPEEANVDEVSGNFFSALGVGTVIGRSFTAFDERNHSAVAVLSYRYWNTRFHGLPGVVGKTLYVDGVPFSIIGVAQQHFYGVESGGEGTDIWVPLQDRRDVPAWGTPATESTLYGSPNWWNLMLMVRLEPGISWKQAASQANPIFARAAYETIGQPEPGAPILRLALTPARGLGLGTPTYREPFLVMMGMALIVLVIASVNIAMFFLVRDSARSREFAVRLALGADPKSLLQQLIIEGAAVVVPGTVLGWFFAVEGTRFWGSWFEFDINIAPNSTVLVFTILVASTVTLLLGLVPLRAASNASVAQQLKGSGVQVGANHAKLHGRKVLVTLQVGLSFTLIFVSGLLLRTLRNYETTPLGMRADQILAFGLHPLDLSTKPEIVAFYTNILNRLRELPRVENVTIVENRPGSQWSDDNDLIIDGRDYTHGRSNVLRSNFVGPKFFETLGIPILRGRDINEADAANAARVAVVNEFLAKEYFTKENPIGHSLGRAGSAFTIVGIAKDSKYTQVHERPMPMAWYSYQQADSVGDMDVELRTTGNPLAVIRDAQKAVAEVNPNIPLQDPRTLESQFEETYSSSALYARLAAFFAGLATLLVAIGLYGTLAYRVRLRSFEIGIRMALGATRSKVLRVVMLEAVSLVAIGLGIGLLFALATSRFIASMLYGLSPNDPVSLCGSVLGIIIVCLMAAFVPAHKAATLEPVQALRID